MSKFAKISPKDFLNTHWKNALDLFTKYADDAGALLCASELIRNYPKFAIEDFMWSVRVEVLRAYISAGIDACHCVNALIWHASVGRVKSVQALLEERVGEGLGVT